MSYPLPLGIETHILGMTFYAAGVLLGWLLFRTPAV